MVASDMHYGEWNKDAEDAVEYVEEKGAVMI